MTGPPQRSPISGGGRHRPFWKLTEDPMLRHSIKTTRRERRASVNRKAMKGIVGAITRATPLYPPLQLAGKQREPGQPIGRSGNQKRRQRRANPQVKGEG